MIVGVGGLVGGERGVIGWKTHFEENLKVCLMRSGNIREDL